MRYGPLRLRGGTNLRGWTFLRGWPYRLNRMLLGRRPHLRSRGCLRRRPFLLSALDGGLLALLHHWGRSRLTAFHCKRLGDNDRLRLAAVYRNELGAVGTRRDLVLLLNG